MVSTNERRFAAECIAEGYRLDGRKPTEARSVAVQVGPSWGFAEVTFDKSQAIASTVVEAVAPASDRPNEGTLSISIDLSPASSESAAREALQRSTGHQAFFETRTAIESFVRESRAIDTEALCILAGVKVWAVRVAVDVINDDGNCTDVAMMAVMASLLHARRPDVTVTGREVRVHAMNEREPLPLPVHHIPLAATFAIYGAGKPYENDSAVLDPTKLEEVASNGTASFSFNSQGEVCGVYKAGGLPLRPSTFANCATRAVERSIELSQVLKQAMEDAAADHPLAGSTRPMLVNAEPTAVIRTQVIETKDDDEDQQDVAMSTWNATALPDDKPPSVLAPTENVGQNVKENVDEVPRKKKPEREVQADPLAMSQPELDDDREISDDEDSSSESSSGSDLESAVISKKGKSGNRTG